MCILGLRYCQLFCANICVYFGDLIITNILCQFSCVFWGLDIANYFVPIFVCILGLRYCQLFCANICVYFGDLIITNILCQFSCVFWGLDIANYFVPIFVCILGDLIFPSVESDSGASSQVEDSPHSGDQVLAFSCICSFSHLHICTFHIFSFAYLPKSALLECIFAYITCS